MKRTPLNLPTMLTWTLLSGAALGGSCSGTSAPVADAAAEVATDAGKEVAADTGKDAGKDTATQDAAIQDAPPAVDDPPRDDAPRDASVVADSQVGDRTLPGVYDGSSNDIAFDTPLV